MKKLDSIADKPLTGWLETKMEKVIKSCRTFEQVAVAHNYMYQAVLQYDVSNVIQLWKHMFKIQEYWIGKQLFPGDKVICISNDDAPVMVARIIEPDYNIKSGAGICFVRDIDTGKDYISFSILVKYENLEQVAEINALKHPERWNKFCLPTNKIK